MFLIQNQKQLLDLYPGKSSTQVKLMAKYPMNLKQAWKNPELIVLREEGTGEAYFFIFQEIFFFFIQIYTYMYKN